ncbi:ATP-binding cassette domain-containing protein [Bacteroidota bacterium]
MIRLQDISKSFGQIPAVHGVSFELTMGESLVILGPTGSGKTTLLKLIAGLELPNRGEIYHNGDLISKPGWASEPSSRSLGYIFQEPALWPHMTVKQNILFGLNQMPKKEALEILGKVMNDLLIDHIRDRYPHEISGGESRLVALARSVSPNPRLLLMDEPLVNLNPEMKDTVWLYLSEYINSPETSIIYVTHDREETANFSDRIMQMSSGELINDTNNRE